MRKKERERKRDRERKRKREREKEKETRLTDSQTDRHTTDRPIDKQKGAGLHSESLSRSSQQVGLR